jgi:hypothetical protein
MSLKATLFSENICIHLFLYNIYYNRKTSNNILIKLYYEIRKEEDGGRILSEAANEDKDGKHFKWWGKEWYVAFTQSPLRCSLTSLIEFVMKTIKVYCTIFYHLNLIFSSFACCHCHFFLSLCLCLCSQAIT